MKKYNTKKANKKQITAKGRQKGNQFLKYIAYGFAALFVTGAIFGDADEEEEAKDSITESQPVVEQEELPKQTSSEPEESTEQTFGSDGLGEAMRKETDLTPRFRKSENRSYIMGLKGKLDEYSNSPNWDIEAQRDELVDKGRKICEEANSPEDILSKIKKAKREGDGKSLFILWGASNLLCVEHNNVMIMSKAGNYFEDNW